MPVTLRLWRRSCWTSRRPHADPVRAAAEAGVVDPLVVLAPIDEHVDEGDHAGGQPVAGAQTQAILVRVAVALVENRAVRQPRVLVDGAVDRAAQPDEKPVQALRHPDRGAG